MPIKDDLTHSSKVGFPEFKGKENVCRDWKKIRGKPNSEIKDDYNSLSISLPPRELLMLMRKDPEGKLQLIDVGEEEDLEKAKKCLEMDELNYNKHKAAFTRLNGLRVVVAKSHILRHTFQLQPQIISLSCNGLPLDKPIDRHITSSPGYRAGIHLWMDVDETTGVGKQEVPRMSVYYQFMKAIWFPLLEIVKPFLGSPQQTTGADFSQFKKQIQSVIVDDDERQKYIATYDRVTRFSNEQDVITGFAKLESTIKVENRPMRIVTHDKTHFDFIQLNASVHKKWFDGPVVEDTKILERSISGAEYGEYKLYLYATPDGAPNALLSKKGNKHQSIDEIDVAVVGYLDYLHRNIPSSFTERLEKINKILKEAEPTVTVLEISNNDVPKNITDGAPELVTHLVSKGPIDNGKYCYLIILSEHISVQKGESATEAEEGATVPESVEEDAAEPEAVSDAIDHSSMTVAQLKDLLKEAGKTVSGKKAVLIERLQE